MSARRSASWVAGFVLLISAAFVGSTGTVLAGSIHSWTISGPDFSGGSFSNTTLAGPTLELSPRLPPSNRTMVLNPGPPGSADSYSVSCPNVLRLSNGSYDMWYMGYNGATDSILLARSPDGINWTKVGVVLSAASSVGAPNVLQVGSTFHMWYDFLTAGGPVGYTVEIYHAISSDGVSWTVEGLALGLGASGAWDAATVGDPWVVQDGTGLYRMYYSGWDASWDNEVGVATSRDLTNWTRFPDNPVLPFGAAGGWDNAHVGAPTVVPYGSVWAMYYHANQNGSALSIGRATSSDGYNWTKDPANPVVSPEAAPFWDDVAVGTPDLVVTPAGPRLYFHGDGASAAAIGMYLFGPPAPIDYVGNYLSTVFDSSTAGTTWLSLSAAATVPEGTTLTPTARVGNVSIPDGTWSPWTPVAGVPALPRTRYAQVELDFTSTLWNVTPAVTSVTLDYAPNAPPDAIPASPSSAVWLNTSLPLLRWDVSDPEGDAILAERVELSNLPDFSLVVLDSGNLTPNTTRWQVPYVLPQGVWYWRVQAEDSYGAWGVWRASQIHIDTTPPLIAVSSPTPGALFHTGALDVIWSASDALSGIADFSVSLDGATPAIVSGGTSSVVLSGLTDGLHTVRVVAVDRAGNAATVTLSFVVDTNVLSINGPYGAAPLIALIAGAAAVGGLVIFIRFRRKRIPPAEPLSNGAH